MKDKYSELSSNQHAAIVMQKSFKQQQIDEEDTKRRFDAFDIVKQSLYVYGKKNLDKILNGELTK